MTKAEIVEKVHAKVDCIKTEAFDMVDGFFNIMKDTLEKGEQIKITGFGNFDVKQKTDRRGRNPQTGESITITARKVLTFKASALLKDAINKP